MLEAERSQGLCQENRQGKDARMTHCCTQIIICLEPVELEANSYLSFPFGIIPSPWIRSVLRGKDMGKDMVTRFVHLCLCVCGGWGPRQKTNQKLQGKS